MDKLNSGFDTDAVESIVVLRSLSLGDLLTTVPALRALRRSFPDACVYLTTGPWNTPLIRHGALADVLVDTATNCTPDFTDIVEMETAQLAHLDGVLPNPDIACNLRGFRPETYEPLLALKPRRLIAFAHPDVPESRLGPRYFQHENETARWARLMNESGVSCDPSDLYLDLPRVPTPNAHVVIHPGTNSRAREWPADRWAVVARSLADQGLIVAVTGAPHERCLASKVVAMAAHDRLVNLAGKTTILELGALVGKAQLVLSGDTGIAHLAVAFRTPSVRLCGPVDPALWSPPPGDSDHTLLWKGRLGDSYGPTPFSGLLAITADEVIDAAHTQIVRDAQN